MISAQSSDRMAWFREARFGMFINWGLYSIIGRDASAPLFSKDMPVAEYEKLADRFCPPAGCAVEWARLAKRAGMRYVVFDAKHCDGFCLFDSRLTDYTSVKRGARRDWAAEVVEAFRAEGLRIGFYYGLTDFHYAPYMEVAHGDLAHQQQLRDYLRGQVRELLANYGKIDLLWYDAPVFVGPMYPKGVLPPEVFDAAGMNALARQLQPEIIINDRSLLPEDFSTLDSENVCRSAAFGRDWEMCVCINDLWGYCPHDYNYKTVNQLIFSLVDCAVQGGNFLLNVAPRADGSVPGPQVERLEAVGEWLRVHGESVYGVERLRNCYFHSGRVTRKGRRLYFHTYYWPGNPIRIAGLDAETLGGSPGQVRVKSHVLTTGLPAQARWDGEVLVLSDLPASPPDKADTVVVVDIAV